LRRRCRRRDRGEQESDRNDDLTLHR
jgi:hypothetical protein